MERLFDLAFARWLLHGDWPLLHHLQRDLVRRPGKDFDVLRTSRRLPTDCAYVEGNRLILTVRGLQRVRVAHDVLADFVGAVRLAYERYLRDDTPTITSEDLVTSLQLSDLRAARVADLLDAERGLFARVPGAESDCWSVLPEIHAYREVREVDQYLAVQQRTAGGARDRPRGLRGWLRGAQPTIRDLLLIAVVAAIVGVAIAALIQRSPLGPATSTDQHRTTPFEPRARRATPGGAQSPHDRLQRVRDD